MALKDVLSKTNNWLKSHKFRKLREYQPEINEQGLISEEQPAKPRPEAVEAESNRILVKTVPSTEKQESIEKLQQGFNRLIEQLKGINENLNQQVAQHENLMARMENLPELLENFPAIVENQKQLTEQMLEQLRATAVSQQQFIESIEKIPAETAKQTDALSDIDHQLAAAADADVQMAESFNRFNDTLDKLNQNSIGQTDGILQMSKTFATSDRYLKYIMSRQNKRFMWIFVTAITVCVLVILTLVGIIIYLRQ
jgi:chromosome segregation ATPase